MKGVIQSKVISLMLMILFIASGCETTSSNYIGNVYPPTEHVDLYFSKKDIRPKYFVMGKLIVDTEPGTSSEKLQDQIAQIAETKGADGVFISSFKKVNVGADTMYDDFGWEDIGIGGFYEGFGPGDATTQYIQELEIIAFFLKYLPPDALPQAGVGEPPSAGSPSY